MIADVSLSLLYAVFGQFLSWLMLLGRATSSKDIELTRTGPVTQPQQPETRLDWADRAVLAALIRQLPERDGATA